jgi:hypothetical protein
LFEDVNRLGGIVGGTKHASKALSTGGMRAGCIACIHSGVKKLPSEDEIRARLRELSDAARRLRQELEQQEQGPLKATSPRLRGLVHDRPLRSSRGKKR